MHAELPGELRTGVHNPVLPSGISEKGQAGEPRFTTKRQVTRKHPPRCGARRNALSARSAASQLDRTRNGYGTFVRGKESRESRHSPRSTGPLSRATGRWRRYSAACHPCVRRLRYPPQPALRRRGRARSTCGSSSCAHAASRPASARTLDPRGTHSEGVRRSS